MEINNWYESQIVAGVRVLGTDTEGTQLIKDALTSADIPFVNAPVPVPGLYNGPPSVPDETKLLLYVGTKIHPTF